MYLFPETEKNNVPVVDIDIGDDADVAVVAVAAVSPATNDASSGKTPSVAAPQVQLQQQKTPASSSAPSVSNRQTLDSRSFWKAGDYVVGTSSKLAPVQGLLEHASVHPKFLHSNATSHKWAFGGALSLAHFCLTYE